MISDGGHHGCLLILLVIIFLCVTLLIIVFVCISASRKLCLRTLVPFQVEDILNL